MARHTPGRRTQTSKGGADFVRLPYHEECYWKRLPPTSPFQWYVYDQYGDCRTVFENQSVSRDCPPRYCRRRALSVNIALMWMWFWVPPSASAQTLLPNPTPE